jgi:hypothetical protein
MRSDESDDRIEELERQLAEAKQECELAGAIADGYYAKCDAIANLIHGGPCPNGRWDLAHLSKEVEEKLTQDNKNIEKLRNALKMQWESHRRNWDSQGSCYICKVTRDALGIKEIDNGQD